MHHFICDEIGNNASGHFKVRHRVLIKHCIFCCTLTCCPWSRTGECCSRCGLDRGTDGPDGKTVSTQMAPLQWIHNHLRASTLLQHENTILTGVFDGPYRISSVCSRNQGEPQSDGQSRTSGESTHLPRYCPTIRDILPCPYVSNDAASYMRDEVDGL